MMIEASNIEGLHLRNLEFEGKSNAEIGVQVFGISPERDTGKRYGAERNQRGVLLSGT